MEPSIEQRLIQLLRDSKAPAVPLRDLHDALRAEAGPEAGSYALLEQSLRGRRDVFLLLETASPLGDEATWPAGTRTAYERELSAAGFDAGPHVSLIDPDGPPEGSWLEAGIDDRDPIGPPLRQLRDSLARLWHAAADNASLRDTVAAALTGCRELPAALRTDDDSGVLTPEPISPRRSSQSTSRPRAPHGGAATMRSRHRR
jgi:hypothetical protein